MTDYLDYDGVDLADLVRRGDASPRELLDAAIARAATVNPKINAIVQSLEAMAVDRSVEDFTGPFAGVPFLIKDLAAIAGVPCSMGSRLFDGFVPTVDADLVARFRAAGFNFFGTTNTPEVGLAATTESVRLGACRNPWNPDHTPGGSSGGAAAAVAAGIVPVAHATDGGGSIRIPASCCGLVGLKPSRGRTPGHGWGGMSTGLVVSRTVRDTAAVLDAVHGPSRGDHFHAPYQATTFVEDMKDDPAPLRIAIDLNAFTGESVDPECRLAVERAAATLETLGHHVEEARIPLDHAEWGPAVGAIVAANVAATVGQRARELSIDPGTDHLERNTLAVLAFGQSLTAEQYVAAVGRIVRLSSEVGAFLDDHDLILSPTLVSPPVPVGWLDPNGDPGVYAERFRRYWGFTNLYNATGQPAISLPLHQTADGLPVGVQLAARYGDEVTLLRIARKIELATPWPRLAPPLDG